MRNEVHLYQTFELFTVIFETFIIHQYLSGLFRKKYSGKKVFLGYAIFCIGLTVLSLYWHYSLALIIYTCIGIYILGTLYYKTEIKTRLFISLLFCLLAIVSEILCSGIISLLDKIDIKMVIDYGLPRVLSIIVAKLLQIIFVKIIVIFFKPSQNEPVYIERKYVLPLLICQIFSIMLAYCLFVIGIEVYNCFNITILLSMIGIMYINIIIFCYFDSIKVAFDYKKQNEIAEIKLEQQQQYYTLLDEYQKEINALHHDIKKHITLIETLIKNGYTDVSEDYVNELKQHIKSKSCIIHTSQPVINALLTIFSNKARDNDIKLDLDIKLYNEIKINSTDLCILIGNLFENAIEACVNIPNINNRIMNARIIQKGSFLLISVRNPFITQNQKRPKAHHGYGLKNIQKVVAKYDGHIDIKTDNGIFDINIIFN